MAAGARLYEPLFGRLLAGVRQACWDLGPPQTGMLVVDVGCGTGALLARYAAAGCRVAGLDTSAVMLAEARRRLGPSVLLLLGEAASLPFAPGAAGLVTATMLFHSLPPGDRPAALAEMARLAGSGGRIVVADHSAVLPGNLGGRAARLLARSIENLAGHGPGVRSLVRPGGLPALAEDLALVVEGRRSVGGGALEVLRLRPATAAA